MNKVVIDLEFCKVSKEFKEERQICKNEIIQIGAIKLDDHDQIIDEFNELVKPEYSVISAKIEALTHITNAMVSDACSFKDAMNHFLDWIGDDMTTVYSWSLSDIQVLQAEAELKQFCDYRLFQHFMNWRDLQKMIDDTIGVSCDLSLKNVLKGCDIAFEGQEHSAIDDARNTAYLYQILQDEDKFRVKMQPLVDLFAPKESITFSMAGLFSGINLEQLAY